jgi:hypothetical protein
MSDVVSMVTWAVTQNATSLGMKEGAASTMQQHLASIKQQAQAQLEGMVDRGGSSSRSGVGGGGGCHAGAPGSQPVMKSNLKVSVTKYTSRYFCSCGTYWYSICKKKSKRVHFIALRSRTVVSIPLPLIVDEGVATGWNLSWFQD